MKPKVGIGVVIFKNGKVLMGKHYIHIQVAADWKSGKPIDFQRKKA